MGWCHKKTWEPLGIFIDIEIRLLRPFRAIFDKNWISTDHIKGGKLNTKKLDCGKYPEYSKLEKVKVLTYFVFK